MPRVIMPKMGDGMEEGTLLKWLKSEGDEIAEGEPIAEIETDKVTLEIEAQDAGVLTKTLVGEGETVPIGTAIATIGEDDAASAPAATAAAESESPAPVAAQASAETKAPTAPTATAASVATPPSNGQTPTAPPPAVTPPTNGSAPSDVSRAPGERLRASPIVKRLAAEHGIDLQQVHGSGPGGRIVKDDILPFVTGSRPIPTAAPAAEAEAAPQPVPTAATGAGPVTIPGRPAPTRRDLAKIRRITGRRMTESKQAIPHFYVTSEIDMAAAAEFRTQVNQQLDDQSKVSFNDLIIKASALALRQHPDLNASFEGGELYDHENIDINVAVALDGGLIAPFIPDADQKSLGSVARMAKDLIGRAKNGGLKPEEFQGGTFTISNLGMLDVDEFIAVINPPQAAILAVGAIRHLPVVENGDITVGYRMKLTVSADHRAVDGAEVARFLQTVRRYLESPMLLALG